MTDRPAPSDARRTDQSGPSDARRTSGLVRRYAPATLLVVAMLAGWEALTRLVSIEEYLLPSPSQILRAGVAERELLASAGWVTAKEVVLGLAAAVVAGVVIAVVLHSAAPLRQAIYPLLIGSQTVPVVVLAPILAIAFGYGIGPKLVIVGLICFFPIVVNTLDGLRSVDHDLLRLMRTLHAGRLATLRRVEFPAALPRFFTGTRIAATYAPIGAVFGEWSGSTDGLGFVMLQATPQLRTALVFASIVVLTAASIALFLAVSLLERLLVPWNRR